MTAAQFELPLVDVLDGYRGKRLVDVTGAGLLLLVTLPLTLLVGIALKLTSPRDPIIFRQRRVGRGGEEFYLLKFRSMHVGSEERLLADEELMAHYVATDHKIPAHLDPRISRLGRILRRTSIDELPQLFNVLCGHMSLVGPRPVERLQLNQYEERAWVYLSLRPGLTGLWQVSGRSRIRFPERALLDEEYLNTCCPRLDLRIMLKTPRAVAQGLIED